MKLQHPDQGVAQLVAGHHLIHKAVLQLELAALEPGGQLFADGLLNDAGPGKADQRPRLGQHDVAQACKAGGHAAGGGVGEHADVQPASGGKALDGGAGLGHLHQAENALLHAGTAAGREDDQRQAFGCGVLHRAGDLFAHGGAHAAHEKPAVQHGSHTGHPADAAGRRDSGFAQAGLVLGGGQLFRVAGEPEHILRGQVGVQLPEAAVVQHQTEPVVAADGHVIAAVGADVKAAGPDGAGGAAAALLALHELGFMPDGPGIPPGFQLKGAFPHPAGEQVSDLVHGVLPQMCAVM